MGVTRNTRAGASRLTGAVMAASAEYLYDRGNPYEFSQLSRDLEVPGTLEESKKYAFEFNNVEKSHETYSGNNVRLR